MRSRSCLAAIFLTIAMTSKAHAQKLGMKIVQTQRLSAPSSAHVYGQIRMEGMQYLTQIKEAPQLTYSQLLSARLSILKETTWIDMVGDVSAGTFFSRGQSHFVVHEVYLATHSSGSGKMYLGRKKKEWSELDRRWQLGLWQPKFAMDALRPEEQGLSGVFLNYTRQGWEVLGFATPIFIPSLGPDIREEGGSLVADSRWYRTPSRNYDFNNRINDINYDLDIPEAAKLVGNGGVAFMGRVGNKEQGPWFTASAGHLPVNDLILKRKNFKEVAADKISVTVSPDVTYHSIYSADIGYAFENLKSSISYLQDEPKEKLPESDWTIQKLNPLKAYAAALEFSLPFVLTKSMSFQMEYLRVNGGGIVDIRSNGELDDITLFDQRLKFTNALSFRAEGQLASFFHRPFVARVKYLYDYDQRGSLLNTEFLYYPTQKWAVVMGGDVLGIQDETFNPSGFLNQYRANDRIYGGMTYVF